MLGVESLKQTLPAANRIYHLLVLFLVFSLSAFAPSVCSPSERISTPKLNMPFPKEISRHVYKTIIRRHENPTTPIIGGANMIVPNATLPFETDNVAYFSFNVAEMARTENQSTLAFEICTKNRGAESADRLPKLWLVAPGSRQGRGLMWRDCELLAVNNRKKKDDKSNKQNKKQRWLIFRVKDVACLVDRLAFVSTTSMMAFAALSSSHPRLTARAARTMLLGKTSSSQIATNHHLRRIKSPLLLAAYYSSSSDDLTNEVISEKSASPPATVSNQYAIDFLLGQLHGPVIEDRTQRHARSIHHSSAISQHSKLPFEGFQSVVPNLCKRQPLLTKVEDVGLQDYIIYPRQFDIGQCDGACMFPLTSEVNPRTHSVVQLLHHLAQPHRIPAPCCVPVSFKPITVLVMKAGNSLAAEIFHDLIVESCGCR